MNRARAKRRLLAWERYEARYPSRCAVGRHGGLIWWQRVRRHHTTHAGIQAARMAAS